MGESEHTKLTLWQRLGARRLRRRAGRRADEPLRPEDWEVVWRLHEYGFNRVINWLFFALPRSPRCGVCGAPFAGLGRLVAGPLGYRPSRKNPTVCATCVELAPPGGMKMQTGILFADLRGFTARFDGGDPEEASTVLRRMLSERVASGLPAPVGTRVQLELKGKTEPQTAYRVKQRRSRQCARDSPGTSRQPERVLRDVNMGRNASPLSRLDSNIPRACRRLHGDGLGHHLPRAPRSIRTRASAAGCPCRELGLHRH